VARDGVVNRRPLWKLAITTVPAAEEAVAELVESTFGQPTASYTSLETGTTTVTAYFAKKPDWRGAQRAQLEAGLAEIRNHSAGKISLTRIRREDWAESWRRHFKPLQIGSALLIRPPWSRRGARKGQVTVVLEPGLSFGTGQHPTTAFCLQQLAARRNEGTEQSFLDIGTGSGILAIAAAKLGYQPVHAFDFDPEAVRITRRNARRNRVDRRIRIFEQDITKLARQAERKYSVICANLTADLLVTELGRILSRLQPDGLLVLAGILKSEFSEVRLACEAAGLRLTASRTENEWRSGSWRFFE
jgi:ribosomal protein L11 methyltransferase